MFNNIKHLAPLIAMIATSARKHARIATLLKLEIIYLSLSLYGSKREGGRGPAHGGGDHGDHGDRFGNH